MTVSLSEIAEAVGAESPATAGTVSGWSIDSRTLNPGDCFFALAGENVDGHRFLAKAFERGAAVAIVDHLVEEVAGLQLVVKDTTAALGRLGRAVRERWNGTVVGVTGSAGKTTTKDAVANLLATRFRTGRTGGNFNNHLGLPLSILRLPDDSEMAVLEMGMNHSGEIRALAKIAKPAIGVVTNVGWAHTENFSDGIEGVARAKRELVEALPPSGVAVLNADDPHVREFAKAHSGKSIFFGFSEEAEVRAENVTLSPEGVQFRTLGVHFESPLAGRHEVSNVLAALSVARAVGIEISSLRDAVRNLAAGKMRGERSQVNGVQVINDCYNANPEAMRSMLELLAGTRAQRRIAVLGEMLELGREAETLHRGIGRFAAEKGIHTVIGIRGAARLIVDEAIKTGMSASAAYFFESPEQAGMFLTEFVQPGDAILFKGSRGVQVERAIETAFGTGSRVTY